MKTKRELYAELRKMMDELKPHLDKVRDFANKNKLLLVGSDYGAELVTVDDDFWSGSSATCEENFSDNSDPKDFWVQSSLSCGDGYSV